MSDHLAEWNSLTQDQRRWVAEAARLRTNARLPRPRNHDDEFSSPDTRHTDADGSMWAAQHVLRGAGIDTVTLVEWVARYLPLHDGDGHYPDLTVDTPWACPIDGTTVDGADEACGECVRRDAAARQHVKRMERIQLRARDEGLECTHGTGRALTVDAYALEGLLDEVEHLRPLAARVDELAADAEQIKEQIA